MKIFYLWVTVLLPEYEDKIVVELIKKGFKISPLADTKELTKSKENCISGITAIKMEVPDDTDGTKLKHNLINNFTFLGIKYHSIVLSGPNGIAWWEASNIVREGTATVHPYR